MPLPNGTSECADGFRLRRHLPWLDDVARGERSSVQKCIHMSSEGWSSHRAKLRMAPFQDAPATPFADSRRESIFFSILFSFSCARVRRFGSLSLFRLYLTVAHSCTVMLTANLVSSPPSRSCPFRWISSMCFVIEFSPPSSAPSWSEQPHVFLRARPQMQA